MKEKVKWMKMKILYKDKDIPLNAFELFQKIFNYCTLSTHILFSFVFLFIVFSLPAFTIHSSRFYYS